MRLILLGLLFPLFASAADMTVISIDAAKGQLGSHKYIQIIEGGLHKDPNSGVITEYVRVYSTLSAYDSKNQRVTPPLYVAGSDFSVVEGLCSLDSVRTNNDTSNYCITR